MFRTSVYWENFGISGPLFYLVMLIVFVCYCSVIYYKAINIKRVRTLHIHTNNKYYYIYHGILSQFFLVGIRKKANKYYLITINMGFPGKKWKYLSHETTCLLDSYLIFRVLAFSTWNSMNSIRQEGLEYSLEELL